MHYFKNQEEEYVPWLEHHPAGIVLNLATGGKHRAMIHTTRCTHLYPPNPTKQHTVDYPKACGEDQEELERWSKGAGFTVALCPSCGT